MSKEFTLVVGADLVCIRARAFYDTKDNFRHVNGGNTCVIEAIRPLTSANGDPKIDVILKFNNFSIHFKDAFDKNWFFKHFALAKPVKTMVINTAHPTNSSAEWS